jgi:transcriptional regulator with XRE-family HTH domain
MDAFDELVEKRKQLGMTRKLMSIATGYSVVWLAQVEKHGERRISQKFLDKYQEALNNYEKLING